MLKNDISAIEEQFNQECTVIELKYEYPGYTGIEKYAIVSSLSQKEIETRFPEQARSYSPFLVLDISFLDVRRDYRNNNKKYEMRSIRSESVFGFNDSDTETHHKEIYVPDFVEQWINVKVIQDTLGHQDISTTMNIYTDATKEMKKQEFESLDNYLKKAV